MTLSWHGFSCFSLATSSANGEATLVIDPYQNETGLRFPKTLSADVVAVSRNDRLSNNASACGAEPFVITTPGEYEVKGVFVQAIAAPRAGDSAPHLFFLIEAERLRLLHLGTLNRPLSDEELRLCPSVDVLLIPVGGDPYLTPGPASEFFAKLEPKIVIPYGFALPGIKIPLAPLEKFCQSLGVCQREDVTRLKLQRKSLPEDSLMVYVLERT